MKICCDCKTEKELSEFHKDKNKKDGTNARCKPCAIVSAQKWNSENQTPEYNRQQKFKKNGITEKIYNETLRSQNFVCAVCFGPQTEGQDFCLDHDHSCCSKRPYCGECFRGLLCHACNQALGLLKENLQTINSLGAYIARFS